MYFFNLCCTLFLLHWLTCSRVHSLQATRFWVCKLLFFRASFLFRLFFGILFLFCGIYASDREFSLLPPYLFSIIIGKYPLLSSSCFVVQYKRLVTSSLLGELCRGYGRLLMVDKNSKASYTFQYTTHFKYFTLIYLSAIHRYRMTSQPHCVGATYHLHPIIVVQQKGMKHLRSRKIIESINFILKIDTDGVLKIVTSRNIACIA